MSTLLGNTTLFDDDYLVGMSIGKVLYHPTYLP